MPGYNRIWAKADKIDSDFNMIKDHVTLRREFGKYWIVIPTREEWEKIWPKQQRKEHIWFADGTCNQQRTGTELANTQTKKKYNGTPH